jgi:hypothetical protein
MAHEGQGSGKKESWHSDLINNLSIVPLMEDAVQRAARTKANNNAYLYAGSYLILGGRLPLAGPIYY